MISLHCFWAKSSNRTYGQSKCHVTYFCFCFYFVCAHERCGCCFIVCWRGWWWWWGEVRLKFYIQGQVGRKILDVDGQGVEGYKNQTTFMDVISVQSLTKIKSNYEKQFPSHYLRHYSFICHHLVDIFQSFKFHNI